MSRLKTILAIIAVMTWAGLACIGASGKENNDINVQDSTVTQMVMEKTVSFMSSVLDQMMENPGGTLLKLTIIFVLVLGIVHVALEKLAGDSDLFPEKRREDAGRTALAPPEKEIKDPEEPEQK